MLASRTLKPSPTAIIYMFYIYIHFRGCTSTSGCTVTLVAYKVLCVRFTCFIDAPSYHIECPLQLCLPKGSAATICRNPWFLPKNSRLEKVRPVRLHVRLCNTRTRKGLSRKHEKNISNLIVYEFFLDTDYTDGHGLGQCNQWNPCHRFF
jgi:hypothetical protein